MHKLCKVYNGNRTCKIRWKSLYKASTFLYQSNNNLHDVQSMHNLCKVYNRNGTCKIQWKLLYKACTFLQI